jgi:glutamate synthase domain-containing protein 2
MLQDDVGLPTLPALVRTTKFLEKHGLRDRVSVIAGGGLVTPGHFLKAMALGADAVYTGTMVVICLLGKEMLKATPFEPPMQVPLYTGRFKEDLDVDVATKNLSNFLASCVEEMKLIAYALGKTALRDVNKADLCTVNREIALMAGIDWGYFPPEEQAIALGGPAGVHGLADELERILHKVQV